MKMVYKECVAIRILLQKMGHLFELLALVVFHISIAMTASVPSIRNPNLFLTGGTFGERKIDQTAGWCKCYHRTLGGLCAILFSHIH